ncbi:MAG: methylmalonyl Co-A mutase-associated GTPase MeaB [Candidatus Cloacimonadaceae bacterium]|nr:methylmalonyl Co-A mutase-associated GTPase MeaB [Candidatus Cloacimonadaceae bacterium]
MNEKRKPEWTPIGAGKEFATSVMPAMLAPDHVSKAKFPRSKHYDTETLVQGVLSGDRTLLSKAITIIESNSPKHFEPGQELMRKLLPHSGKAIRIGITGVPGAGKSTFIESFGLWLFEQGHQIAVLAVDPSSSLSKGSILGDKTRMDILSRHPQSFIRPSPSSGILGGVARKTRESIVLCEAAGYDVILIETVGVGQSEITVRSMVDFFLLMQIAGAGDELQGIKKGIMELADMIIVNKADGENIPAAQLAQRELNHALHYLRPSTKDWKTKALLCSAIKKTGIEEIWQSIQAFVQQGKTNSSFSTRRTEQITMWFESLITEAVLKSFYAKPGVAQTLPPLKEQVAKGEIPVLTAVKLLLEL